MTAMGHTFHPRLILFAFLAPLDLRPPSTHGEKFAQVFAHSITMMLNCVWLVGKGLIAILFGHLRQHGATMKLDQIKRLAQHYLDASLGRRPRKIDSMARHSMTMNRKPGSTPILRAPD